MSAPSKSRFFSKFEGNHNNNNANTSEVPAPSITNKAKESQLKSLLTKRSRYFPPSKESMSAPKVTTTFKEVEATAERALKKRSPIDDVLRKFKASRLLLRGSAVASSTPSSTRSGLVSASASASAHGNKKEEENCPICLSDISDSDRAGTNTCQHTCFCFSCLVAWGRIVNKCPLCKTKFTEIISVSDPQKKELFCSPLKKQHSDEEDQDEDEYEDEGEEEEHFYEDALDLAGQLYGYDESDGFVVGDEVVEYVSSDEDGLLDC